MATVTTEEPKRNAGQSTTFSTNNTATPDTPPPSLGDERATSLAERPKDVTIKISDDLKVKLLLTEETAKNLRRALSLVDKEFMNKSYPADKIFTLDIDIFQLRLVSTLSKLQDRFGDKSAALILSCFLSTNFKPNISDALKQLSNQPKEDPLLRNLMVYSKKMDARDLSLYMKNGYIAEENKQKFHSAIHIQRALEGLDRVLDAPWFSEHPWKVVAFNSLLSSWIDLDMVDGYLKGLKLTEKGQADMAECFFEIHSRNAPNRLDEVALVNDIPFSSPNIPEKVRVATLALYRVIRVDPENGFSMMTQLLQNGTLEVEKKDSLYKLLRIPKSCYKDVGKSIQINLSQLVEDYQNSLQKTIDSHVNIIRGKWEQNMFCNELLSLLHDRTISGYFTAKKYLEILKEVSKSDSAESAIKKIKIACIGKGGLHDSAENAIHHAAFALPFDGTVRVNGDLANISTGNTPRYDDSATLKLNKYLTLTGRELNSIDSFLKDLHNRECRDVCTTIAEMIEGALVDDKKATQFHANISYLSALYNQEKDNPFYKIMFPHVVEDIYQGRNVEFFRDQIKEIESGTDITFKQYIDYVTDSKKITSEQQLLIQNILDHYNNEHEKLELHYNLATFVNMTPRADATKVLKAMQDLLSNYKDINIPAKEGCIPLPTASELVTSLAYELANPDLITQYGPTCDATAFEFLLCKDKPSSYVEHLSLAFKGLVQQCRNGKKDKNLNTPYAPSHLKTLDDTDTTAEIEKQENSREYKSMELFQTIYFNFSRQANISSSLQNFDVNHYGGVIQRFHEDNFLTQFDYNKKRCLSGLNLYEVILPPNKSNVMSVLHKKTEFCEKALLKINHVLKQGGYIHVAINYGMNEGINDGMHATIITGANYDEHNNIISYNLYHGHEITSKRGHRETVSPEYLILRMNNAVTIEKARLGQKLFDISEALTKKISDIFKKEIKSSDEMYPFLVS